MDKKQKKIVVASPLVLAFFWISILLFQTSSGGLPSPSVTEAMIKAILIFIIIYTASITVIYSKIK